MKIASPCPISRKVTSKRGLSLSTGPSRVAWEGNFRSTEINRLMISRGNILFISTSLGGTCACPEYSSLNYSRSPFDIQLDKDLILGLIRCWSSGLLSVVPIGIS